jgi:hypothetical protein
MKLAQISIAAALCISALPVHADFVDFTNGKIDSTAGMSLRTAHYWYNSNLDQLVLQGRDCQLLNLVLNVTSGEVQIQLGEVSNGESTKTSETLLSYPDKISASTPLFVYSLYSTVPDYWTNTWNWKTFKLVGKATGTAFAYCYSDFYFVDYVGLRSGVNTEHKSCKGSCSGF